VSIFFNQAVLFAAGVCNWAAVVCVAL